MALIAAQQITAQGLAATFAAASSGGDTFEPGPNTVLVVKNGSGSPVNVTIDTTATAFGEPISNIVVAVAAGAEEYIGPFPAGEVAQESTGLADVTYSAVTTVTVAALTF